MKFTTARLCGGKALMAISVDDLCIDIADACSKLEKEGIAIDSQDEMMAVFKWNGMETTLYTQGKVMFFPLEDKPKCIAYATEILEKLVDGS